jgi:hypothetical protein
MLLLHYFIAWFNLNLTFLNLNLLVFFSKMQNLSFLLFHFQPSPNPLSSFLLSFSHAGPAFSFFFSSTAAQPARFFSPAQPGCNSPHFKSMN